jgi:hypothetical protein
MLIDLYSKKKTIHFQQLIFPFMINSILMQFAANKENTHAGGWGPCAAMRRIYLF